MIPLEGAGKGDTERLVNKKDFGRNYEAIFGKRDYSGGFKRERIVFGEETKGEQAFFVPNTEPFFNAGLGCITYGTRDAEKKGKKLGLICTGGEKLKKIPEKDHITPILEEGIKIMRHRGDL